MHQDTHMLVLIGWCYQQQWVMMPRGTWPTTACTPRSSPSNRNCLSFSVNRGLLSNYSGCCVVSPDTGAQVSNVQVWARQQLTLACNASLGDKETQEPLAKTTFFFLRLNLSWNRAHKSGIQKSLHVNRLHHVSLEQHLKVEEKNLPVYRSRPRCALITQLT